MSLGQKRRKVHFIGIGGIGMSGIAELLLNLGHEVSGSDLQSSEITKRLERLGATVQVGHSEKILLQVKPDVVVYSTAVPENNPERVFAVQNRIALIRRAEMLAELMRLKRGIAIAGSHGKTSTTGLISLIFKEAKLEPTVVIGGRFDALGSNASLGGGEWLIAEADESDASFLRLSPEFTVVTNIDREHLDYYGRFEGLLHAYEEFLDRLPFYGLSLLCSDCRHLKSFEPRLKKPRLYYGYDKEKSPDYWVSLTKSGFPYMFSIFTKKSEYRESILDLELSVPGKHHVLNASAAAIMSYELGVPKEPIYKAIKEFQGVQRRFQSHGFVGKHHIIEDYAHHPTEIRATMSAATDFFGAQNPPVVIFQPHRYSRTKDLWQEFSSCFQGALKVVTLPIYAASEPRDLSVEQIDREKFAENLDGQIGIFCESKETVPTCLSELVQKGVMGEQTPVLVLGAGDVPKVIPYLKESGKF